MDDKLDIGYGVAGIVIGAVILIVSVDLLTHGAISGLLGKAPARLSVVPRETEAAS